MRRRSQSITFDSEILFKEFGLFRIFAGNMALSGMPISINKRYSSYAKIQLRNKKYFINNHILPELLLEAFAAISDNLLSSYNGSISTVKSLLPKRQIFSII